MALVKCKECKTEISNKADACPNCGAKPPKKTSFTTWFVLFFIVAVSYSAMQDSGEYTSNSSAGSKGSSVSTAASHVKAVKSLPPKPSWGISSSTNKMTGVLSAYAISPTSYPSKKMSFPYSDVNSWMGVGCNKNHEWVFFGFSGAPNLSNDQTKDGYNLIRTRIKWDDKITDVELKQDWGAEFIHFIDDKSAIMRIDASGKALLELQWHGQQTTYFDYTLNGLSLIHI